jgi:hypothetical protein
MQQRTGDGGSRPSQEEFVEADPVDVADQQQGVDQELEPDLPEPDELSSLPLEAEPVDVVEQRLEVPVLDEEDG